MEAGCTGPWGAMGDGSPASVNVSLHVGQKLPQGLDGCHLLWLSKVWAIVGLAVVALERACPPPAQEGASAAEVWFRGPEAGASHCARALRAQLLLPGLAGGLCASRASLPGSQEWDG